MTTDTLNKQIKVKLIPFLPNKNNQGYYLEAYFNLAKSLIKLKYTLHNSSKSNIFFSKKGTNPLWEHTCFELFLLNKDLSYFEFNFAPNKDYNIFLFQNYRTGKMIINEIVIKNIIFYQNTLTVEIDLQSKKILQNISKINITAVIERSLIGETRLDYWALAHKSTPDFHDPDLFLPLF